jgi:DNA-binding Xre family transcriptional regulator
MKLVNYLDELNWTKKRLDTESGISITTIQRMLQGHPVQRETADAICDTLTRALGRTIKINDVDEITVVSTERPKRKKHNTEEPTSGK